MQVGCLWCLIALFTLGYWFQLVVFFCKQANEVVKANNLSDVVIVLHGRVEVGTSEQYMFFNHWNIDARFDLYNIPTIW